MVQARKEKSNSQYPVVQLHIISLEGLDSYSNVESGSGLALLMSSVQLRKNFSALQTRILRQRLWNDLECLSELLDGVLLQTRISLRKKDVN